MMSKKSKKEGYVKVGVKPLITVDPTLPSFEGNSYFDKKAKAAKELLKKVGLPQHLTHKPQ